MKKLLLPAVLAGVFAVVAAAWAQSASKPDWVRADVVAVDAARSRITLKHEPIRSRTVDMDAMTMPFKAADASLLKPLKAGDRVRFVVLLKDGELLLSRIEAIK